MDKRNTAISYYELYIFFNHIKFQIIYINITELSLFIIYIIYIDELCSEYAKDCFTV